MKWFVMFNLQGRVLPLVNGEDGQDVCLFSTEREARVVAEQHFLVKQGQPYEVYEAP